MTAQPVPGTQGAVPGTLRGGWGVAGTQISGTSTTFLSKMGVAVQKKLNLI